MAWQPSQKVRNHIPWTVIVVEGICMTLYFLPGLAPALVHERKAILGGELWRLLTGHLIHFSAGHLLFNLLGFFFAGLIVSRRGYTGFGILCVVSALVIGIALLLQPDLAVYGGLSGMVNAAIVYVACRGIREGGGWGRLSFVVLALTVLNTILEVKTGLPTFGMTRNPMFLPVPLAHLVGGLTGAIIGSESWQFSRYFSSPVGKTGN